ncbi:MAG: hypothetical protein ACHQ53_17145 [Polyangiales bacterium]
MTSIKPKDTLPPAVTTGTGGATGGEPAGVERSGEGFRDLLGRADKSGHAPAVATSASHAASKIHDPIADLAQAVKSGALSADRALEQLVERAAGSMAGKLSPAQRAELTAVLQTALQSDPALRALRESLG